MHSTTNTIRTSVRNSVDALVIMGDDEAVLEAIELAAGWCINTLQNGGMVFLAGNGGSAAQAQHMAAELTGRFKRARPGMAAIALNSDTSTITAIGNDYGFTEIFARQVEALGAAGDVFIGFSTSGMSANILAALAAANAASMRTIGFTGGNGGKMAPLCDVLVAVPYLHPLEPDAARIQEAHLLLAHALCEVVEADLFRDTPR